MPNKQKKGLIQIYTGDGKGKTTAALGAALRAAGAGLKVAIIFFDKGGSHYSERKILNKCFKVKINWWATGLDRIDPKTGQFRFGVTKEDKTEAERGLKLAKKILTSGKYDLVILDELNQCVFLKMLQKKDALAVIDKKPEKTELIITGRNAPQEFIDRADLVTEMKLIKHPFCRDIKAREGIDY